MKAVVTAGGRITGPLAELTGEHIKCLITFDGQRLIDRVLAALHGAQGVTGVVVVGPPEIRDSLALQDGDTFVDEADSGPANFLLGLQAAGDVHRVVFSTSDLPFLTSAAVDDLVARGPHGYGLLYPIWTREEIRVRFPYEASSYMPLRDGDLTGSSVMLVEPRRVLDREPEIRALFDARKDFRKLAGLIGVGLGLRFAITKKLGWRVLSVQQLLRRFVHLAGFPCDVVRGCDPSLSFDIDHERDWNEALTHLEKAGPGC